MYSRRINKADDHILVFNKSNVSEANSQKHLGIVLNNGLSFKKHLKMISNKVFGTMGLIRKLYNILQRSALLIIYKAFFRSPLDYGNTIYDHSL